VGTQRGRWLWLSAGIAAVAALGVALRFGASLALTLALAGASMGPGAGDGEPRGEAIRVPLAGRGGLDADLYRAGPTRGALLLVHGLSPAGRRQPDLVRLARLLARDGLLVLVPQYPGLARFDLSGTEVEDIRESLGFLRALGFPVGVAGFSFGAGPALLGAADAPGLTMAGSFGGYADLRHVILFLATGVHEFQGRRYRQPPLPYNRWKLLALLGGFLEPDADRRLVRAIAARRLADPGEDTGALEARLGTDGRVALALALARDEAGAVALLDRLPPRAREELRRLSPLAAVPRLRGRLLVAHGTGDDSIPFTESLRLAEASGGRARLALLETFHHTGPRGPWRDLLPRAADGWGLFRLVDDLRSAF
jgi:hypothetical protein